ncbi:MAG: ATP synthase F1 subunit epsilon [Treponema sp.]|nr:ATP synthase F1 subunit epsilon [Treponema sp.]
MQKNVKLSILTPEKVFFNGEVSQIIAETPDGEMGIMAGHMSSIAVVSDSLLKVEENGVWRSAAVGQGIMDVSAAGIEFFVDTAEWGEDIDVQRSEKALHRAEERLHSGNLSHVDYIRTRTAITRATARLKTAHSKKR